MRLEDLREKREQILSIAERYGATNVRVFGSVVRSEARPDSDVDILIDLANPSKYTWLGAGMMLDLQELLGAKIDLVIAKNLHWYLRERILEESVSL
jgi:uncharacterized protein